MRRREDTRKTGYEKGYMIGTLRLLSPRLKVILLKNFKDSVTPIKSLISTWVEDGRSFYKIKETDEDSILVIMSLMVLSFINLVRGK